MPGSEWPGAHKYSAIPAHSSILSASYWGPHSEAEAKGFLIAQIVAEAEGNGRKGIFVSGSLVNSWAVIALLVIPSQVIGSYFVGGGVFAIESLAARHKQQRYSGVSGCGDRIQSRGCEGLCHTPG